jgi:hypothetical protein
MYVPVNATNTIWAALKGLFLEGEAIAGSLALAISVKKNRARCSRIIVFPSSPQHFNRDSLVSLVKEASPDETTTHASNGVPLYEPAQCGAERA